MARPEPVVVPGVPPVVEPVVAGAARLSTGLLLALLVAGLLVPDALTAAGPALLVLAAVLGLPHGAADVALLRRSPGPLLAYAVAAGGALVVALAVPGPALVVLLLLSAAHFAEGEQGFDRLRGGPCRALPAAAVGWSAVVLPAVAHPDEVRELLAALSPGLAAAALSPAGRAVLVASAAVLVLSALVGSDRRTAGEVLLVAAALVVAPPLAAFAVWFAGWHAVRHLARLAAERPGGATAGQLARRSALPSLAAAGGLAVLAATGTGVSPAVVLGLLALTVPHTVVVLRALRVRPAPGLVV